MSVPDGISIVLLTLGIFIALSSAVGVLRMPDFFTRIHPAGKNDTLAQFLVVLALIVQTAQTGQLQVGLKLCWISLFLLLTTPSSTYAIARAAHVDGRTPWRLPPEKAKPPAQPKAPPGAPEEQGAQPE